MFPPLFAVRQKIVSLGSNEFLKPAMWSISSLVGELNWKIIHNLDNLRKKFAKRYL